MSIFARIFNRPESPPVTRPAKGTPAPASAVLPIVATATYPELAAALDRIAEMREGAERDIEGAAIARRNAVIALDDAAITAAEAKSDSAHRLIEALDVAEPEIVARMRELAAERRRADFEALSAEGIPTGRALVAALDAAAQALAEVEALRHRLAALGTHAEVEAALPRPPVGDFAGMATRYAAALDQAAGIMPAAEAERRATTFAIRVLRRYSLPGFADTLMPGEARGYASDDAWRFVAAGVATWHDEARIPAIPAVSPLPPAALAKLNPPRPDPDGMIAVRVKRPGFGAPGRADADFAPGATLRLPAIYATAAVSGEWAEFDTTPVTVPAEVPADA